MKSANLSSLLEEVAIKQGYQPKQPVKKKDTKSPPKTFTKKKENFPESQENEDKSIPPPVKPNYILDQIDHSCFELTDKTFQICKEVFPNVGFIIIEKNSNEPFVLIARNFEDPSKTSYYKQAQRAENEATSSKTTPKSTPIYTEIIPKSNFIKSKCLSLQVAKEKALILESSQLGTPQKTTTDHPLKDFFLCRVCETDDSESPTGFALSSCIHYFCLECWHEYLTLDSTNSLECMEYDCSTSFHPEILSYYFKRDLVNKFIDVISTRRMMQKDFIECRQCGRVSFLKNFDVNKSNDKKVVCDCGVVYCIDCKLRVHLPLTCEEKRMFTSKDNESNSIFHVSNDSKCPRCGSLIEKTEGCNHMTCICRFEFCYLCEKPYSPSHSCDPDDMRTPHIMIDNVLNLPEQAVKEILNWFMKRQHVNLWQLKKKYRTKRDISTAFNVVEQYSQECLKALLYSGEVIPSVKRLAINFRIDRGYGKLNIADNILEVYDSVKDLTTQFIANPFFAVDSFFFLSGLLLAFLWFKEYKKDKKKVMSLRGWGLFYLHRVIRLSPPYYLAFLFFVFVYPTLFHNMPLWIPPDYIYHTNDDPCPIKVDNPKESDGT
uniref:RBR-type E3 ubiquitin transferase n=1 Tax=Acrobeloides nanus TaxID=290746 RepID=A0A914EGS7_9BILA